MRSTVELIVRGKNIDEILANAKKSWQGFVNNDSAELPPDSELKARDLLIAYITVRTKIETKHG
jgi:hypothetical protein